MTTVLLALGTNLGDRVRNLRTAIHGLSEHVRIEILSPVYETAPMYVLEQPAYLNMALKGETDLEPEDLLKILKDLESAIGRTEGIRFGPRVIDIDILFYADRTVERPELQIPHPRMAERAFVLRPLADIVPDWRHPVLGRTIAELADTLSDDGSLALLMPDLMR